jgi:hypothetical protein
MPWFPFGTSRYFSSFKNCQFNHILFYFLVNLFDFFCFQHSHAFILVFLVSLLRCQKVSEKVWNLSLSIQWCYGTRLLSAIHQAICPSFDQTSIFLIPKNISPFALSTTPLDCGWYTDENFAWVPKDMQYSLKV